MTFLIERHVTFASALELLLLAPKSIFGVCVWSMLWYALFTVVASFTIMMLKKRKLLALFSLFACLYMYVAVSILCPFLRVL